MSSRYLVQSRFQLLAAPSPLEAIGSRCSVSLSVSYRAYATQDTGEDGHADNRGETSRVGLATPTHEQGLAAQRPKRAKKKGPNVGP